MPVLAYLICLRGNADAEWRNLTIYRIADGQNAGEVPKTRAGR